MDAYIDRRLAPLDYLALYPAKIIAQNADGSLELRPDDARVPDLSSVPIRLGLPGVSVTVAPGSRVLIGFENGKPSAPVATIWDASTLKTITITASATVSVIAPSILLGDAAGSQYGVARVGDPVDILFPPLCPVTGTLNGAPFAGVVTFATSGIGIIAAGSTETYST